MSPPIRGDYPKARSLYEESLILGREAGNKRVIASTLNSLGEAVAHQGNYSEARSVLEESLALNREIGDKNGIANTLLNLGAIATYQGVAAVYARQDDVRRGAIFGAAASVLYESMGVLRSPSEQVKTDDLVAQARAALGEEAFATAWAKGQAITWEQAVEMALGVDAGR